MKFFILLFLEFWSCMFLVFIFCLYFCWSLDSFYFYFLLVKFGEEVFLGYYIVWSFCVYKVFRWFIFMFIILKFFFLESMLYILIWFVFIFYYKYSIVFCLNIWVVWNIFFWCIKVFFVKSNNVCWICCCYFSVYWCKGLKIFIWIFKINRKCVELFYE